MTEQSSYRAILRSSSIIGAAQVINILSGILKMKAAAVLIGPTGVGLAGLYMNLMQTAASVASLGFGAAGTRQIAAAYADGGETAVGRTRRALFWGTLLLSLIGAFLFWLASGWIALAVLDDPAKASDIAWLAPGVALTVAAGSQGAVLTGMRRLGDLARINVGAGIAATTLGVAALWWWGQDGLLIMLLVAPATTLLLGHFYVVRIGPPAGRREALPELAGQWLAMARVGVPVMLSFLLTLAGHLFIRTLVQRELGAEALGHFQAAWAVATTYLGFVLGAMGSDYYPRLTASINEPATASRLVNEQIEVALLLCAPVLLTMLGCAPWVIRLLYSGNFDPSVEILRWQLLGDVLKVISWPLAYILLARGAGTTYILTESTGIAVLVLVVFVGQPLMGLKASGVAYLLMYVVYLPLVAWFGARMIGFRWSRAVLWQALTVVAAAAIVDVAGRNSDRLGALLGLTFALAMGISALLRLSRLTGGAGQIAQSAERMLRWVKR